MTDPSAIQLTLVSFHLGSQTSAGRPPIPDIKTEYVKLKGEFVKVCTAQEDPTLDEVKDHCIDLIEALADMPWISYHKDITKAQTMTELARVVCFRLSNWVSYDFFCKVITYFQPALKSVYDQLMHYEDQLKLILQQKLKHIIELQQR